MNLFASIFIITFIVVVAIWLFISYALYRIGKKFQIGSFLGYCVPFYNAYLIYKCADVPLWNFIGLFIPILNIYCCVNIWGSIAERLGKSYWLYGITILLFSIPVLILAFDSSYPVGYDAEYDSFGTFARYGTVKEREPEETANFIEREGTKNNEYVEDTENETAQFPFVESVENETTQFPLEAVQESAQVKTAEKRQYKPKINLSSLLMKVPLLGNFFVKQVNELVGVDIGTTTIKVCALKNTKGLFTVANAILKTYDQDLLSDGHIVDIDFLASELRNIFEENKIKSRNVACALSSYSVISKKITIPMLQEEELERTISAEVENAIPFPMRDIYYSYHVMGVDAEKQSMMNVKIVAAKKEIVDAYVAAFNLADLSLQILDVDIFDISNIVEQIYNTKEHSVVIVDIGASVTNIAILNGEDIEFTREILVGGKYLTNLIQKSARMNYKDAEGKKLSADGNVVYLFEDFIFNIASEINKTIRFYLATKPKEDIGKIYVTGGSSLLPGLKEKIVEDTGIQVEVINPFLLVGDVQNEIYENMKEFMAVPLYLSTRIVDIQI
jgi:type IV pilus assembly protein PilM